MSKRNLSKSEKTRQRILETAKEVFCEEGFVSTTINIISKRVGVGYGTVYSYFDNKSILFIEVMDDTLQDLYVMARSPFFPNTVEDAYQIIVKQTESFLKVSVTNRNMMEVIEEAINISPEVREKWQNIREYFLSTITQDIKYSQSAGLLREDVIPYVAAVSWYSTNEWILWECVKSQKKNSIQKLAEQIAKMYVRGIYLFETS